jgi:DNA helicase-2/ATP-dependent DNA helicase PcrA
MAIQRILNVPNRRLGEQRLSHFIKHSESNSRSIWDSIEAFIRGEIRFPINDKQAEDNLAAFVRTIKLARTSLAAGQIASVAELIDFVREKVKYDGHLRKKFGAEADDRIANLEELKTFANEIAKVTNENELPDIGFGGTTEESPLERFIGNITLMTDVQDGEDSKFDNVLFPTAGRTLRIRSPSRLFMLQKVYFLIRLNND